MKDKITIYLANNAKYFPAESITLIKNRLEDINEDDFIMLASLDLKDPTTMLIISIVGGSLGIDRFMLGDIGMGVLKLLTVGLCGVLTIIDWFSIQKRTKEMNLQKIMLVL
ncbi:TM2 domain-containing protein [Erysipelothrix urinaevulpis]|uniref:TM2 domain-containing protein n=1 Tax=Erysipelothrix urinaevulpis TaxID=2683717 RepID=UPI001358A1C3|nr:TM2 domain-containing protein [Erysipelothrix urinaevulpis]